MLTYDKQTAIGAVSAFRYEHRLYAADRNTNAQIEAASAELIDTYLINKGKPGIDDTEQVPMSLVQEIISDLIEEIRIAGEESGEEYELPSMPQAFYWPPIVPIMPPVGPPICIDANVITLANIYKRDGEWCYAAFTADGFDSSDTIGCFEDATEDEARSDMAAMFPAASIVRVADPQKHQEAL